LIRDARERRSLSALNVRAGVRAKRAIAYVSARHHFAQATGLLDAGAWSRRYRDTFDLYLLLSECEYLVGNFAVADELFELLLAPEATVPEVRAVINLLCDAAPCAYIGRPALFPLISLRAVNLSLQHGNTEQSSYVYAVYALMLVGVIGDIPSAFEFSEMS